jgi:hypothetical protein
MRKLRSIGTPRGVAQLFEARARSGVEATEAMVARTRLETSSYDDEAIVFYWEHARYPRRRRCARR